MGKKCVSIYVYLIPSFSPLLLILYLIIFSSSYCDYIYQRKTFADHPNHGNRTTHTANHLLNAHVKAEFTNQRTAISSLNGVHWSVFGVKEAENALGGRRTRLLRPGNITGRRR